jgi:restriction system protein
MGRRSGFVASLAQVQRELARVQAAQIRAENAKRRQAEQASRAYMRSVAADERERKRLYAEERSAEVASLNDQIEASLQELGGLLTATLSVDDYLDFEALKRPESFPPFDPGELGSPNPPPTQKQYEVPPLGGARRIFSGARDRHAVEVAKAKERFERDVRNHADAERNRQHLLDEAQRSYLTRREAAIEKIRDHNREVDSFRLEVERRHPEAVVAYFDMILQRSNYPPTFPRHYRLAFVPQSRQLVVELQLPPVGVVPEIKSYRYMKTKDEVVSTPRPGSQIKALYSNVLAQVAVRTLHELFEADRFGLIETLVLNGYVDTVDRATGKKVRPTLVTVRTTKDVFAELDLEHVDPLACLKHLGAGVSKSPKDLIPVRPVLEFNMVDARFVEETDVLSMIDPRPNLMELSPSEFEGLITNLFSKMGLETRLTRPSRDGGVDCVAYDNRPIFGGKVVIQAKRYKGTVGVSAVRDLYGTVHNEGATKGILVATSGYGGASYEFANGKPLELIDGAGLLYLLAEHAGLEARIIPPEDWIDPTNADLA